MATWWQTLGSYEHEVNEQGYTGWYRCVGGKLANGKWPAWHSKTGAQRYA